MTDQTTGSAAPKTAAALAELVTFQERTAAEADAGENVYRRNVHAEGVSALRLTRTMREERVLERLEAADAVIAHALVIWQRCMDDTAASAADALTAIVDLLNEYNVAWEGERDATG